MLRDCFFIRHGWLILSDDFYDVVGDIVNFMCVV